MVARLTLILAAASRTVSHALELMRTEAASVCTWVEAEAASFAAKAKSTNLPAWSATLPERSPACAPWLSARHSKHPRPYGSPWCSRGRPGGASADRYRPLRRPYTQPRARQLHRRLASRSPRLGGADRHGRWTGMEWTAWPPRPGRIYFWKRRGPAGTRRTLSSARRGPLRMRRGTLRLRGSPLQERRATSRARRASSQSHRGVSCPRGGAPGPCRGPLRARRTPLRT